MPTCINIRNMGYRSNNCRSVRLLWRTYRHAIGNWSDFYVLMSSYKMIRIKMSHIGWSMSSFLRSVFFWLTKKSYYFLRLDQNSRPVGFLATDGKEGVDNLCSFFSTLCISSAILIFLFKENVFFSILLNRNGCALVTLLVSFKPPVFFWVFVNI